MFGPKFGVVFRCSIQKVRKKLLAFLTERNCLLGTNILSHLGLQLLPRMPFLLLDDISPIMPEYLDYSFP
jgi:hypothetical protein